MNGSAIVTAVADRPSARGIFVPGQVDMWVFVLFETLIFTSYFIVYMVCRGQDLDLYLQSQARLSSGFGVANTLVLLFSSWSLAQGVRCAREGRYEAALRGVLVTMAAGALFVALKLLEWSRELAQGLTFATNEFFSFYYFMTGIHVVHVLIGFIVLGVAVYQLRSPARRSQEILETCATYWHMVDYLWAIIFALLYVMR